MSTKRFTVTTFALSALVAVQSAGAQERNPGQIIPSNGQQGAYEARRTPAEASHAGMSVQQVVVHKLMRGNQAEIELAQIAQQEAKHKEVKQFAQMMIKDHQQALQELQRQQGQGNSAHAGGNAAATSGQQANAGNQAANDNQAANGNPGVVGQPGGQVNGQQGGMQHDQVPQQFVQLVNRTCDNSLQQSKEMLQQHRDKDFDMAYMGHQIVMHSMMLAELKAIESDGPKQLQPVIQEATRTTESHLKEAKQIVEKLAANHPNQDQDSDDESDSDSEDRK